MPDLLDKISTEKKGDLLDRVAEIPKTIYAQPVPLEDQIEAETLERELRRQPVRVDLRGPQFPGGTPRDLGPSEPLVRYQRQLEERREKIQEEEALELFYTTYPEKRPRKYKHFVDELLRNTGGGALNVAAGGVGTLASVSEASIFDPEQLEGWAQKLHQKSKEPAFTPSKGGGWKGFVAASVGQAAPYMASAVGATLLTGTPLAAFGVGYSVEGDNAYRTAKELGAPEDEAQTRRFLVGTINGAIEQLQVSRVFKFANAGRGSAKGILKAASDRAWKKALQKGGKLTYEAAKHSAAEALEEVLQETTQIASEAKYNPKVWDEATQRILMAGLGGGTVGLFLGGGGRVMTNLRSRAEAGQLTPQQLEVMNQTKTEYDAIVAEGGIGAKQKAEEVIRKGQGKLAALEGEEAAAAFEAEIAEMDREVREIQRPAAEVAKVTPEPPAVAIAPEIPAVAKPEAIEELAVQRGAFQKYQKSMPDATEPEIVRFMIEDGLRPPEAVLKRNTEMPEVEEIRAQDKTEEVARIQAEKPTPEIEPKIEAKKPESKPKAEIPPRPLVNPHATALQQDKQLIRQQAWDRKYAAPTPAKPKVAYRAGDLEAKVSTPPDLEGIYFADHKEMAKAYTELEGATAKEVKQYKIELKNPATEEIENQVARELGVPSGAADVEGLVTPYGLPLYDEQSAVKVAQELKKRGYDGVIRSNGEIVVFDKSSITPTPAKPPTEPAVEKPLPSPAEKVKKAVLPPLEPKVGKPAKPVEKEIKYEKEAITEPAPSPKVEPRLPEKAVPKFKPTGTLDPTDPKEALEITRRHAQWLAGGGDIAVGGIFETKWEAGKGELERGGFVVSSVEYTPEQIDTAYRTVQKPVPSPMADTKLFAMPGKESEIGSIAEKMSKLSKPPRKTTKKATLTKPKTLSRAKAEKKDHIKAVSQARSKEDSRYAITGVLVEGDTIVATDGRRMFWAKGKWGKDGVYADAASLKKGLLGKLDKTGKKFPKWKDIVPDTSGQQPILVDDLPTVWNRAQQAMIMTTEESRGIVIIANKDGTLGFAGASPEAGHAEINVQPGGRVLGAVNPQYFLDMLAYHSTRGDASFKLYFADWDRPMLSMSLDGKTFTMTMPINLGEEGPVSEAIAEATAEGKPGEHVPEKKKPAEVKAKVEPKRIISNEAYEKAKKRLTDNTTFRAGLDPQGIADLITIGAYHFESGVRKFAEWSKKMIEEFGEKAKPHLQGVWDKVSKEEPLAEAAKFTEEAKLDEMMTKAEIGEVPIEGEFKSQSGAFNEHLDYFQNRQLPKKSKIPVIQAQMRTINGKRLAGTITAQKANKFIRQLRKELFETARKEGVALRMTKGGKLSLAVRKAGTYVPEEFAQYGKFKNIAPILGGGQDITRAVQQMDGALAVKEKVKTHGQAGPLERHVLWPTRDISMQKLNYIKEKTAELKSIFKARRGSKEDKQVNLVLEQIAKGDRGAPIKDILNRKTLRAIASPKVIRQALDLRSFYDDLIEEQNLAREMRDQDPIPYRHNYSPHILRDTTIWERLMMRGQKVKDVFAKKADLPDYIKPNKPFNPRELAREAGIPYEERVLSATNLAESYLVTAAKDIFNTSIIQNNKAFIQQLEAMGHDKSANYLADWTAEGYAGIKPKLDRAISLPGKVEKGARYFNRLRNMAVFPLNMSWSMLTQTSSLALTVGRYGTTNTMRGFVQWLSPKIRKQAAENYYSYIVKSTKQGKLTRQDAQNLIGQKVELRRTRTELAQDISTLLLEQLEKLLTGVSIRAAHLHGKKRGLTGEALRQYASDGGAKTQSMYNDEDKPALLRSLIVKTAAPYQTFAYEVVNTMNEWAGRTGTPPDSKLYAVWTVTRFLAAATVFAALAKKFANKDVWSWKRPPIPFAEFWLNPIVKTFSNEWIGSASGLTSPIETATRVAKGIDDVLETGSWRKLRNELIKYGPGILGIPGGVQISRTVDAIIAYAQGGVRDRKGRLMFKMEDPQDLVQAIFSGVWSTEGGRGYLDPEYKWQHMTISELEGEIAGSTYKKRYKRDGKWYPKGDPHKGKEEKVARLREILKEKEPKTK